MRADHQLQAANALVDQAVRITTIGADLLKTKADVLNHATAMLETRPFAGERLRSELQAITQDLAQIDGPIAALQLESADLLARAVDQYDLAARLFQEAGQPDMAALCLKSAADTRHGARHQAQMQAEGAAAAALGLSESPP